MSKADYRALRESLGLSQQDLADHFSVNINSVKRWERSGEAEMPEDVQDWLFQREGDLEVLALKYFHVLLEELESAGHDCAFIVYYRCQEELDLARKYEDLPKEYYGFVNTVARRVAEMLTQEGYTVEFYYPNEVEFLTRKQIPLNE